MPKHRIQIALGRVNGSSKRILNFGLLLLDRPKNTGFLQKSARLKQRFSYWELQRWFDEVDAIVIGAGLVGSMTALNLRRQHPNWNIVVLDRSEAGGATTRNAGFACFGSPSELLEDWETMGPDAAVELVRKRWTGLALLRNELGDDAISYRTSGSLEAFTDDNLHERCLQALPAMNEALSEVLRDIPFKPMNLNLANLGLQNLVGAIGSPLEGDLDTAKLHQSMRKALNKNGINLVLGLDVSHLDKLEHRWKVETNRGAIESSRVFVTTNAWAGNLLNVDVKPIRNLVLVSNPLPGLSLTRTIHHDRGYVYAREVDGRVLIGGGRQWHCNTEQEREERLVSWAKKHLIGCEEWTTAHAWVGQLGIGEVRSPVVKELEPGLFVGVRMGGMGIAIGSLVGQELASLA